MICSTPAFILKSYDIRETSKIGVFYTRDFGKIKGILKGIRKDPKKFSTPLTSLSLNHMVFYKKRVSEIHLVSQCDLIDDFAITKGDLKGFAFSSFIAELLDSVMPLEDANLLVFELIFDFLNSLREKRRDYRHIFQIKILNLSGFKPHFDSCLVCDCKISSEAYFSHIKGGLLCPGCLYNDRQARRISEGLIASILYIEKSDWQRCQRINMLPSMRRQLGEILESFLHFHVGRILRTNKFIHEFLAI